MNPTQPPATPTPAQASTEDWCEAWPDDGHSWTYTHHAGMPVIETRTYDAMRAEVQRIADEVDRQIRTWEATEGPTPVAILAELRPIAKALRRLDASAATTPPQTPQPYAELCRNVAKTADQVMRLGAAWSERGPQCDETAESIHDLHASELTNIARCLLALLPAMPPEGPASPPQSPLPDWERELLGSQAVEAWNAAHPVGTQVRYWPEADANGMLTGHHIDTTTRSEAWTLGHGTPVVKIEGRSGGVALSHLYVLEAAAPQAQGTPDGTGDAQGHVGRGPMVHRAGGER